MSKYGIALDIGTSGFRAQAIRLDDGKVISTAITTRHPIPGANVIDHVNFAINNGPDQSHRLMVDTVNIMLPRLKIDLRNVSRFAVCGNPFQLSLFQNIEIRDLAFAGKEKLKRLGVVPPKRDGAIVPAADVGIDIPPEAEVYVPPAVSHEIGADALAMLLKTKALEQGETCMVIDYGTNAEMALVMDGEVYTGSAAAGPALEGQQVEKGMLAAPGAISEVVPSDDGMGWRNFVLDDAFIARTGDLIDPRGSGLIAEGDMHGKAIGITGTGVIAALACGMDSDIVRPPQVMSADGKLHFQDSVFITSKDVEEAGKAIGAIRAGYLTLMREAGIWTKDVKLSFMSGASGLYVDAVKAQKVGLVPPGSERIIQLGNTSLALARDIVVDPGIFDELKDFAKHMRARHCMFATSDTFKDIYAIELSLWTHHMPLSQYNTMLDLYKIPHLTSIEGTVKVERRMTRDIQDLGTEGIEILSDIGVLLSLDMEACTMCGRCQKECPERAIKVTEKDGVRTATIRSELCMGTACKRCERSCKARALDLKKMKVKEKAAA